MLRRIHALALLLSLSVATACGSTTPTDPPGDGDDGGGAISTGSLQLTVNGLGSGVDAALTVTGPGGFSRTVAASSTLTDLAAGDYTVAAAAVDGGSVSYEPAQTSQTVTVQADQSTLVVVDYVAQLGGLQVTITGLPLGATADASVTGPGGFAQSVQNSVTLSDLPVGDYTVTAQPVTSADGDDYEPSPASQTVTVPFDQAPEAPIEYQLAAASLEISVSGLPGGVDAAIEVSGPGGYSATVTSSQTLTGLAAGDYTVEASAVLDGTTTYVPDPVAPVVVSISGGASESTVVTYAALALLADYELLRIGQDHGCGIDDVGAVNCWGTGNQGQLGTGLESDQQLSPVGAAAGPYVQVAAASAHTCARTAAGQVDCWGSNILGQSGTGAPMGPGVDPTLAPSPVSGGHSFDQISTAGDGSHTCGIDQAGAAWCWGWNKNGQLGDGTTTDSNEPVAVTGGQTFVDIVALPLGTCALDAAGNAWCWGNNALGELGVSTGVLLQSSDPVQMDTDLTFASLGVGGAPCALTSGGQAYCWSGNFFLGSTDHQPVLMADGRTFVQLVKGNSHACGLDSDGAAWCWGWNNNGQLGDGTTTTRASAELVTGGHVFQTLASGSLNTCGVDLSGTRWCWGTNYWGQLGIGITSDWSLEPVQIGSF